MQVFVPTYWHTAEFFTKQSCSTGSWSDAPWLWDAISSISGTVDASDHTHIRATEGETHWNEFSALLYNISCTHRKSQDTVLLLGHCSIPCLSWQGPIFPENCMKELKGLQFHLGSDFVLRRGFSFTEEVNEVDKSQSLYSPKTPLSTIRCLALKKSFPVTLS